MSKSVIAIFVCIVSTAVFVVMPTAAQQAAPALVPVAAPVPPAILAAKKVFISNAGADSGLFPHPFSGNPDRAYSQFYANLQAWGRFEPVGDPQNAGLLFELQLTGPAGPANADKPKGASDPSFTESIAPAYFQKIHARNFDDALTAFVSDLKNLTAQTTAAAH